MISDIFFNALEGFIIIVAFSVLSNQKNFIFKSYINGGLFVLVYTIYSYLITQYIPSGIHTILISVLTMLILNFLFNGNLIKSMLKIFLILLVMSIVESTLGLIYTLMFDTSINIILEDKLSLFILSIICKLIETILVITCYKLNINILWLNDTNPNRSKYKQTLILIFTVIFFLVGANIYISREPNNLFFYNILTFVIYVILIIAMLSAFREGSKLEILQFASELQKDNIQQLIAFNEMVAKERHEYKNHLNTILGLCTLNKPDLSEKIKIYINNYANKSQTQNLNISSGNDFVDAIINVKYNNAKLKEVELIADFEAPLSEANIAEDMAVTVISNIIENAFESIVPVQREKKYISIRSYIENNNYHISISNNGPMISEADKKKIFSAGFSTKDNNLKTRGFGLSIVQSEIERCGGEISINSTEEETEFLIVLKVKEEQKAVV